MSKPKPRVFSHDHETCRGLVCLLCFRKPIPNSSGRIITENNYAPRIRKYWLANYDPCDEKMPNGICAVHRNLLLAIEKKTLKPSALPNPIEFSDLYFPRITRNSGVSSLRDLKNCDCDICLVARDNPGNKGHTYGGKNQGRFPYKKTVEIEKPFNLCKTCFQLIGPGVSHPQPCSKADRPENLSKFLDLDKKSKEKVVSSAIKQKQAETPRGDSISFASGRNKELKVQIGQNKPTKCLFPEGNVTAEHIQARNNAAGLTQRQSEVVNAFDRNFFGKNTFEPGIKDRLRSLNKSLESFFDVKLCKMDSYFAQERKNGQVDRHLVFCKDVKGLLEHLKEKRGYHSRTKCMVKIYIDGGGQNPSSLKVSLTLEKLEDETSSPSKARLRWSYAQGVSSNVFKDSGIMRLQLLAITENINESYENIEIMLDQLNLDSLEDEGYVVFYAWDMKVENVYYGIGSNSSTCPCTKCELPKKDFGKSQFIFTGGKLRTIGSIRKNAHVYQQKAEAFTGRGKLSSAEQMNCEKAPLCKSKPNETLVVALQPFMILHNILGIVNDLYNHLDKLLKNSSLSAKDWAIDALKLKREKYFGGNFKGNQCDALLNNLDKLEELLKNAGTDTFEKCSNLLDAFKAYKVVKDACFGLHLDPNYEHFIQVFGRAWQKLGLNATVKDHDLFVHAVQFLEFMESKGMKHGLGFYGEHTGERVHSAWDDEWAGQSRQLNHPDYPKHLLQNVIRFNSKRVGDSRAQTSQSSQE